MPDTSCITGLTENENNRPKSILSIQEDQQSRLGDNGTLQTMINDILQTLDKARQEFDEKYRSSSLSNDNTNGDVQLLRDKMDGLEQRMNGLEELKVD